MLDFVYHTDSDLAYTTYMEVLLRKSHRLAWEIIICWRFPREVLRDVAIEDGIEIVGECVCDWRLKE